MRTRISSAILGAAVTAAVLALPGRALWAADPVPADKADPAKLQAEVPVKQVVLFSSGVGYFEHFGSVTGNGATELRFKTQQINDVLKSLVLQDMDGGKVTTITYASQDPVEKTLRSFQVDITGNPSLAEMLNQLRGARLTVTTDKQEKVEGTVLGVEKRQEPFGPDGKQQVRDVSVMNLLVGAGIRSVKLDEVRSLQLEDPELRAELEKALAALAQARDQDKKPVQIHFRGDGERRVRVGYVVETPVWKTSYRLILSDAGAGGGDAAGAAPAAERAKPRADGAKSGPDGVAGGAAAGPDAKNAPLPGKAQLQGWAIVENQTDSDWDNVQLSLVSGRPISFIQNLYSPLYVPRPVVQPELFASLTPQTYTAGLDAALPEAAFGGHVQMQKELQQMSEKRSEVVRRATRGASPAAAGVGGMAGGGAAPMEMAKAADEPMNAAASVSSVASATDVGELFQYTVGSVSLPRQKSAMIPIVSDGVEVEKLSIYNRNVLAKYPLNGARVRNTSGKHLLQGPVTVLDAGAYAGDARIDDVPPGQERLLSYGIDQQVLIDANTSKHEDHVLTGKIVKGVLQVTHKDVFTQDYTAQNKGDKDKTLLIEHPRRGGGWKLVETQDPVETTEQLYRFKGQSPAGKQTKLTVREENVRLQEVAILPADFNVLQAYVRTGAIPRDVKDALLKAVAMKSAVVETERTMQQRQQRINEITAEQDRIRQNLKTVQPNTDYYRRLEKKLNDQETEIEKLQAEVETLTKTRDGQRKALEDYVAGLNVG